MRIWQGDGHERRYVLSAGAGLGVVGIDHRAYQVFNGGKYIVEDGERSVREGIELAYLIDNGNAQLKIDKLAHAACVPARSGCERFRLAISLEQLVKDATQSDARISKISRHRLGEFAAEETCTAPFTSVFATRPWWIKVFGFLFKGMGQ